MDVLLTVIRLTVMLAGFTLCLACLKFTWLAIRGGEGFRAWGLASYGLLIITPSIVALYRFNEDPVWVALITYAASMFCGVMALRYAYTINPEWKRLRNQSTAHRK